MTTRAIVLVGGRGTRLQPLTDTRPKSMLPIVDVPFLAHQLAWLKSHGITNVIFACGFLPQAIVGHFGDGASLGMDLRYVIEPEPLGTGGAIGFAARAGEQSRVIVCNGDVLTDLDIGALTRFHTASQGDATIALTPVEDPTRYGLVRTDAHGLVLEFVEKPDASQVDTNLINAGTYVLDPAAIDRIPDSGACSIERDIFPALANDGKLFACGSNAYWNDIGTHASFLAATGDLLNGRVTGAGLWGNVNSRPRGNTYISATARVSRLARIKAPAHIADDVVIDDGAVVGPLAVVLAGAHVGADTRIVDAIVLEGARIGQGAQVTRAIVGEGAIVTDRCVVTDGAVIAPNSVVEGRAIVHGDW